MLSATKERVVAHIALITQSTGVATVEEWAKLNLNAPNSRVLRVTRLRRDTAVTLEEVVLPLERLPAISSIGSSRIFDITDLAQRHGLSLGRATERVSIVPATKDVAAHLGIAAGANVMKLDRVAETADGEPIEWRVAFRKI
jgi:GntR family transcriptional regulator